MKASLKEVLFGSPLDFRGSNYKMDFLGKPKMGNWK